MSLSQKIKNTVRSIFTSLKEQRVIFILSILAFVSTTLHIYKVAYYHIDEEYRMTSLFWDISLALIMSCLFTLPAAYLTRTSKALKKYLIQVAVALGGGTLGYFARKGFGNSVYEDLYFWGIFFAVTLFTVFIFIPKENQKTYMAGIVKHFCFSLLLASILFGGGSLLIITFQNLIYEFDPFEDIYECYAAFCYYVFALNIFVYYMFYRREEESSGKPFKIIFLYILFPVFGLLIFLLYAYLIKALVLLQFPQGQVNIFVSFASTFYFIFYFILKEYDELPVVKFFYKFGKFIFIPLICVQIIAYFIRLNAYGFTGWRYSSLMFIIFSVIMFTLTFIKNGAYIKYSILVLAGIILFASVTPFNLINVAYKNQENRMIKILVKYDMFDIQNNCLKDYDREEKNRIITLEEKEQLKESNYYLTYITKLPLPEWFPEQDERGNSFYVTFGLVVDQDEQRIWHIAEVATDSETFIDISGYSKMKYISINKESWDYDDNDTYGPFSIELPDAAIEINGKSYDIKDVLFGIESSYLTDYIYCPLDDNLLCITSFYYEWDKSRNLFYRYSIHGYLFYNE